MGVAGGGLLTRYEQSIGKVGIGRLWHVIGMPWAVCLLIWAGYSKAGNYYEQGMALGYGML